MLKITGKGAEIAFVDKHKKQVVLANNMVLNYDGTDLYIQDELLKISGKNKGKSYAHDITKKYAVVSVNTKKDAILARFISYGTDGNGIYSTGTLAEFEGSGFAEINSSTGKVTHKVVSDKEQLIYVSDNYYTTFCKGTVKRYRIKDNACVKKYTVKAYEKKKEYTIQICEKYAFIFMRKQNGDMKLLDATGLL